MIGSAMAHILIVDDEDKLRHLLSMMLERRGHTTDQAANGREALEKLHETSFDMVFLVGDRGAVKSKRKASPEAIQTGKRRC